MAVVIVLEDAWDGHYELASACHHAGHQVLALQHPSLLQATLRTNAADLLVVDAAIPGVSLAGIGAAAAEAGIPVIATGYSPWSPVGGLTAFVPKPAAAGVLAEAVQKALQARRTACAA